MKSEKKKSRNSPNVDGVPDIRSTPLYGNPIRNSLPDVPPTASVNAPFGIFRRDELVLDTTAPHARVETDNRPQCTIWSYTAVCQALLASACFLSFQYGGHRACVPSLREDYWMYNSRFDYHLSTSRFCFHRDIPPGEIV